MCDFSSLMLRSIEVTARVISTSGRNLTSDLFRLCTASVSLPVQLAVAVGSEIFSANCKLLTTHLSYSPCQGILFRSKTYVMPLHSFVRAKIHTLVILR